MLHSSIYQLSFQSTLPREERQSLELQGFESYYFNPRSHERSDRDFHNIHILTAISIHAPTRGATVTGFSFFISLPYFNPRSHERSDLLFGLLRTLHYYFNPRSHERSDGVKLRVCPSSHLFQSTLPREERHDFEVLKWKKLKISIHAPTRGATENEIAKNNGEEISIHAPTRGATIITTMHKTVV